MLGYIDGPLYLDNKQVAQVLGVHDAWVAGKDQPTIIVLTEITATPTKIVVDKIVMDKVMGNRISTESAILIEMH